MSRASDDGGRHVDFASREFRSVLSPAILDITQHAKWHGASTVRPHWKGVPLLKDPWDIALYQMLLWELQPRTVVEFGSGFGGSATWMADIARALGLETRTISYDVVSIELPPRPDVTFLHGDCTQLESTIDLEFLGGLGHPMLVVEDAHANVGALLDHLHPIMRPGDYLIVEDTLDAWKHDLLSAFMAQHADDYLVDTGYTDQFGYNATWNWNAFLLRR